MDTKLTKLTKKMFENKFQIQFMARSPISHEEFMREAGLSGECTLQATRALRDTLSKMKKDVPSSHFYPSDTLHELAALPSAWSEDLAAYVMAIEEATGKTIMEDAIYRLGNPHKMALGALIEMLIQSGPS